MVWGFSFQWGVKKRVRKPKSPHSDVHPSAISQNHFVSFNEWLRFGHLQMADAKAIASKHHIREVTKMVFFWTALGH